MGLTATAVQAMPYKLYNEKGLLLLVKPGGGLLSRFEYKSSGIGKPLSLGMYPVVRRKGARIRAMKRGDSWPQELTRA